MESKRLIVPTNYQNKLNLRQTEAAIKVLKDCFEVNLANALNLQRVSAPLCVFSDTGLNDDLNGSERAVKFDVPATKKNAEIVHSLAKWKRAALGRYGFEPGEGLYTDMNAIRRDEDLDNIHSIYVDQWDWEMVIEKKSRDIDNLKQIVANIFDAMKKTERCICEKFDVLEAFLPQSISFVTTQELEDMFPHMTGSEREMAIAREKKAVFIMGIGGTLKSGKRHDGRAPDYDDWALNGDIVVHYPVLDIGIELSSMGIRVDEETLKRQLDIAGCPERADMPFHKSLLGGELPYTVGGGIGQSRLCMMLLNKAHVGEVQVSLWDELSMDECERNGIVLL